eukprot:m.194667 g.194667  ORF g.194667 m.194667 type:complete len:182 (-) comp18656_c0_seq4:99-644(-)
MHPCDRACTMTLQGCTIVHTCAATPLLLPNAAIPRKAHEHGTYFGRESVCDTSCGDAYDSSVVADDEDGRSPQKSADIDTHTPAADAVRASPAVTTRTRKSQIYENLSDNVAAPTAASRRSKPSRTESIGSVEFGFSTSSPVATNGKQGTEKILPLATDSPVFGFSPGIQPVPRVTANPSS